MLQSVDCLTSLHVSNLRGNIWTNAYLQGVHYHCCRVLFKSLFFFNAFYLCKLDVVWVAEQYGAVNVQFHLLVCHTNFLLRVFVYICAACVVSWRNSRLVRQLHERSNGSLETKERTSFLYSMSTAVLLLAYWFEILDRCVLLCLQKRNSSAWSSTGHHCCQARITGLLSDLNNDHC